MVKKEEFDKQYFWRENIILWTSLRKKKICYEEEK